MIESSSSRMRRSVLLLPLLAALSLAACETATDPAQRGPYTTVKVAGDGQVVVRGTVAPELVIQVRNADGDAVAGVPVQWTAPYWAEWISADSVTGANGIARALWKSVCYAGDARFTAGTRDVSAASTVTFTAETVFGPPVALFAADSTWLVTGESVSAGFAPRDACYPGANTGSVSWSVSDAAVLSLADSAGTKYVVGLESGRALVIAQSETGLVDSVRVAVHEPLTAMHTIAAGAGFGCALDAAGDVHCWGNIAPVSDAAPEITGARRVVTGFGFTQLAAFGAQLCALDAAGVAWCWGSNIGGTVGDGTAARRAEPVAVGGDLRFMGISGSWSRTCAVTTSGEAWCWGLNSSGALGDGTTTARLVPTRVATDLRFTEIATAAMFTCGLTAEGATWCWGMGPAPWGGFDAHVVPLPTVLPDAPVFAKLAGGGYLAMCGLTADGEAWCWGTEERFLHEKMLAPDAVSPRRVDGGRRYESISLGANHACAVTAAGEVDCWGGNMRAQLGFDFNGANRLAAAPMAVPPMRAVFAATMGSFTCGIGTDDRVICWSEATAGLDRPGSVRCTWDEHLPNLNFQCSAPRAVAAALEGG